MEMVRRFKAKDMIDLLGAPQNKPRGPGGSTGYYLVGSGTRLSVVVVCSSGWRGPNLQLWLDLLVSKRAEALTQGPSNGP